VYDPREEGQPVTRFEMGKSTRITRWLDGLYFGHNLHLVFAKRLSQRYVWPVAVVRAWDEGSIPGQIGKAGS
jgi:hypothetical protein